MTSEAFGYDQYGNLWVQGSTGITLAGNTPTANVYSVSNNQISTSTYDAAGNLQTVNGNAAYYDAENRLTQVAETQSNGGATKTFVYDGMGQRVVQQVSGGTTVYVYDAFEKLAAEYSTAQNTSPCNTCYISTDYLGSVRMVTGANSNVVARHDYTPFGQEIPGGTAGRNSQWGSTTDIEPKFTGQIRDQETGNDFFNARYYTSSYGRFMSPDPANAGADITNPQSWNGYSYVWNNPLSLVDPSGACGIVVGGGTQTPNTAATAVQQAFANSIGGLAIFPYANESRVQSAQQVIKQSENMVTPETQVLLNTVSQAVAAGNTSIELYGISAGAQVIATALDHMPAQTLLSVGNIAYVSPVSGNVPISPSGGQTGVVQTNGIVDALIEGNVSPLIPPQNILNLSNCGHGANCEVASSWQFLMRFRGTPCTGMKNTPSTKTGGGGGGGSGNAYGAAPGGGGFGWDPLDVLRLIFSPMPTPPPVEM